MAWQVEEATMTAALLALLTQPAIYVNQIGYDLGGPKEGVVAVDAPLPSRTRFTLVSATGEGTGYAGQLSAPMKVEEWTPGRNYYRADFSSFRSPGRYRLVIKKDGEEYRSPEFEIGVDELAKTTIPAIAGYYRHQRADSPTELATDSHLRVFGSDRRVDLRGGWCDASGDVSKYLSHLAYANFMSPQQTPLVVWSLVNAEDLAGTRLREWGADKAIADEARWGADYLMRCLSEDGYFYMIVFSYFDKNPEARQVVGLHANSVTTDEYQAAYREGGGMAIAALARISRWTTGGEFTPAQYLAAAKRGFAHLEINNLKYDDDGKENIIDDYSALMAATELWLATGERIYRDAARMRAQNLSKRLTPEGYFRADDDHRPFWHASDAGLPIVALARYLDAEKGRTERKAALATIRRALDYELRVTDEVSNPFGYARQTFNLKGEIRNGFFIPQENETGWWWQGENARLGSLATAALVGGRLVYPGTGKWGVKPGLARFAARQLGWILGQNPYDTCFMFGFGAKNVPSEKSQFGHGTERGGISNGITGGKGHADGSGIDFRIEDGGNEWRWKEQWLPHAAWFLQAVTATLKP